MSVRLLFVLALVAGAPVAQSTWQLEGTRGAATVRAGTQNEALAPRTLSTLPAGPCQVHFPFTSQGKPGSLRFEVADGDRVVVAGTGSAVTEGRDVPLADTRIQRDTVIVAHDDARARAWARMRSRVVDLGSGDQRVELRLADVEGLGEVGVVARSDAGSCYRCIWSPSLGTLRLERLLGGDHLVLRSVDVPKATDGEHRLAMQADGFRLQVWLDDAPALQVMDGAIATGMFGIAWSADGSEEPRGAVLTAFAPAAPVPSAALVQPADGRTATLHAFVPAQPGSIHALELQLDRPHALLPLTPGGFEPWVMQRPAAPRIASADPAGSLGAETCGEVPFDGVIACRLAWPDLPALRGEAALVRLVWVTPSGDVRTGATPSVHVVF